MYIVSACLAGFNTRHDGENRLDERIKSLVLEGKAIPLCPEQLAGLNTPRPAVEFKNGGGRELLDGKAVAIGADGKDYSPEIIKGAKETLAIALMYGVEGAYLKDGSPSCGVTYVHSNGQTTAGRGAASELLSRSNIKVMTVDSL